MMPPLGQNLHDALLYVFVGLYVLLLIGMIIDVGQQCVRETREVRRCPLKRRGLS